VGSGARSATCPLGHAASLRFRPRLRSLRAHRARLQRSLNPPRPAEGTRNPLPRRLSARDTSSKYWLRMRFFLRPRRVKALPRVSFRFKVTMVSLGALMLLVAAGYWGLFNRIHHRPFAFEGTIVDARTVPIETKYGSYPLRYVRIRERSGNEFDLDLPESLAVRAKIGMTVRRRTPYEPIELLDYVGNSDEGGSLDVSPD
jgi:hypothetical protein